MKCPDTNLVNLRLWNTVRDGPRKDLRFVERLSLANGRSQYLTEEYSVDLFLMIVRRDLRRFVPEASRQSLA